MADSAALICHSLRCDDGKHSITFWADATEALEAMRELQPCSKYCVGCHSVVWRDNARFRVASYGTYTEPTNGSDSAD